MAPSPAPRGPARLAAPWLRAGVIAAATPELWHGLPYAFRVTVYGLCGLMMATVVALILTHKEEA
jgi:hypothetical protein